jgi:hypothetical protein
MGCCGARADKEVATMQRPPLMFAAIVIVIFLIFLLAIGFWSDVFPGPYLHIDKATP